MNPNTSVRGGLALRWILTMFYVVIIFGPFHFSVSMFKIRLLNTSIYFLAFMLSIDFLTVLPKCSYEMLTLL